MISPQKERPIFSANRATPPGICSTEQISPGIWRCSECGCTVRSERQPFAACKGAPKLVATKEDEWQLWKEKDGRWHSESFIAPGRCSEAPSFKPHHGESLSSPVFLRRNYATLRHPDPVDVVIPLGAGSRNNNEELRYALRSLVANFDDLGKIWIVGEKPSWLKPDDRLVHLPVANICPIADVSITHKVRSACIGAPGLPRLSEKFVFCADDHLMLRPLTYQQLGPYHCGDLVGRHDWKDGWSVRLLFTREWLLNKGRKALHGDSHVPIPMERDAFVRMTKESPWRDSPGLCIGTLYLNWTGAAMTALGNRAAFADQGTSSENLRAMVSGRWFLTHTTGGYTPELRTLLTELFPDPTPWEADTKPRVISSPPTISVIVPTLGRSSLARTLESIRQQGLIEGDEVLVVEDGPNNETTERAFAESGLPGRYFATGTRMEDFGGTPRNLGMRHARGQYLAFQDDDDVYIPGAFDAIRHAIGKTPNRPMMFRMKTPGNFILWQEHHVRFGNAGTPMFICPNIPDRLGRWGKHKGSDFAFITTTLRKWPEGSLVWRPEVISHQSARGVSGVASGSGLVRKNLLYHIYPYAGNREWRMNVEHLAAYWDVFTGRKIVGIALDDKTDTEEAVREAFPDDPDIEWFAYPNDPQLGETITVRKGLRMLESLDALEATFYAHAKGVLNTCAAHMPDKYREFVVPSVRRWREAMYDGCLATANLDRWLRSAPFCGCFLRNNSPDVHRGPDDPPSTWHYAGTFWWFNHAYYFGHPFAQRIRSNRFGPERHPGELFPQEECRVLATLKGDTCSRLYRMPEEEWDRLFVEADA